MADQAGYTGPNKLAPLKSWFDKNATSTGHAKTNVDNYAAALAALPANVRTNVTMDGPGRLVIKGNDGKNYPIGPGGMLSPHAAGGLISGDVADRDYVLGALMPGEVVVPTAMVKAGGGRPPARPAARVRVRRAGARVRRPAGRWTCPAGTCPRSTSPGPYPGSRA